MTNGEDPSSTSGQPKPETETGPTGSANPLLTSEVQNVNSIASSGTMQNEDMSKSLTFTPPQTTGALVKTPKQPQKNGQASERKMHADQAASPAHPPSGFRAYSFGAPSVIDEPNNQRQGAPVSSTQPKSEAEYKPHVQSNAGRPGKSHSSRELPVSSVTNERSAGVAIVRSSPDRQMYSSIAPRKVPGAASHPRPPQKTPRAKRRRHTGAGKRWSAAADQFVREIPPVPYYSDPRRQVPMRDMRGWIKQIAKSTRTWDRFMNELTQEDLSDGGDFEVCRYILASVIFEAQDPNSAKTQTRQAVNNAIKRELTCPKAQGQSSRGQTFRELFRSKAKQAGFMTSALLGPPDIKTQQVEDGVDYGHGNTFPVSELVPGALMESGSRMVTDAAGKRLSPGRLSESHAGHPLYAFVTTAKPEKVPTDAVHGLHDLVDAVTTVENSHASWYSLVRRCERTPAGDIAYWTSPDLASPDALSRFVAELVGIRNIFELKRILIDFRWIQRHAQVNEHGIVHLVKHGYDALLAVKTPALNSFEREGYRLIRNALMLIRPVLQPGIESESFSDPRVLCAHLATQLYGRLLQASHRFSVISSLLESIRVHAARPWLRPLNPCFESPKADIAIAVRSGVDAVQSAIAMSKDGSLVLTSADNHNIIARKGQAKRTDNYSVRVWDIDSGRCVSSIVGTHKSSVISLAITDDKRHVISCAGRQLIFWNIMDNKGKFIPEVTEPTFADETKGTVFSMAVLPDSQRVVVAHERDIYVWKLESDKRQEPDKLPGGAGSGICCLDVSADGKYLASGDESGHIDLWNIEKLKKVNFVNTEESSVFSVSFMPRKKSKNGTYAPLQLAFGITEGLRIWTLPRVETDNPGKESITNVIDNKVPEGQIYESVECTENGTIFSGSDDGVVRMWKQTESGQWNATSLMNDRLKRWGAGPSPPSAGNKCPVFIAVNHDGTRVASSTNRPLIPVWDIGQYEDTLKAQKGLSFQSLLPHQKESTCFLDMTQENGPLGTFFEPGSDSDIRCKRPIELITPGNLLQVVLYDSLECTVTFDENISMERRCGTFERNHPLEQARKGVAVSFREGGGQVFLVMELDERKLSLR